MKTLKFNNGDHMPILGLGTWKSGPGDVYKAVKEALHLGYRHIDCAPIYGNEAEIGQALRESFNEGAVTREQLWITSKLWNDCHAPGDVQPALEQTLSHLQLDYLDLYLIHWPVVLKKGVFFPRSGEDLIALDAMPVSATWEAMEVLVDKGLCRHIGVSNFSTAKLKTLIDGVRLKPEMLDFCGKNGVHLTAYSPLGSQDRPDVLKAENEPVLLEDPTIAKIARQRGATQAQVLNSWAIHRETAVIPKSVNPERMKQNLESLDVSLTRDDMQKIAGIDRNRRYLDGKFWAMQGSPYTVANLWDE